ncbi:MAG: ribose-5-phosphate isomerase A, partial [Sulfolobales archaeon]
MEIIVGEIRSEVLRARVRASEEAIRIIESVKADIIGVGSGSTIKVFIGMLSREFLREKCFISTSYDTTLALSSAGARCIITDMPPEEIDIAVDSADEIDRLGNMLKGGGGALFREKITLLSAIKRIIIADEMKLVDKLGRRGLIPVEIAPYAYNYVRKALMRMS